jgi:hypothetical protein
VARKDRGPPRFARRHRKGHDGPTDPPEHRSFQRPCIDAELTGKPGEMTARSAPAVLQLRSSAPGDPWLPVLGDVSFILTVLGRDGTAVRRIPIQGTLTI